VPAKTEGRQNKMLTWMERRTALRITRGRCSAQQQSGASGAAVHSPAVFAALTPAPEIIKRDRVAQLAGWECIKPWARA
jgi:hypothetical protein